MTNEEGKEMIDFRYDKIRKQIELSEIKKRTKQRMKKSLNYAIEAAGDLTTLIERWSNSNPKNVSLLALLPSYYRLSKQQKEMIDLLLNAAELAGCDVDVSHYV